MLQLARSIEQLRERALAWKGMRHLSLSNMAVEVGTTASTLQNFLGVHPKHTQQISFLLAIEAWLERQEHARKAADNND
jgi:hypothetical protein